MSRSHVFNLHQSAIIKGSYCFDNVEKSTIEIIALQDSRKPDLIGKVYRDARDFEDFLESKHEKAERLNDLRSRRRARLSEYRIELPEEVASPVDFDYC